MTTTIILGDGGLGRAVCLMDDEVDKLNDGLFRIVPRDVVLADIRQQVAAGAQHITVWAPPWVPWTPSVRPRSRTACRQLSGSGSPPSPR